MPTCLPTSVRRWPGADVDVVTNAVGLDSRIGRKYLKGALGYRGPCFPRDNIAFGYLARLLGAKADVAEATDRLNRHQIDRLFQAVSARLSRGGRVGILGLSYKPDTGVIEESQGVMLAARLADQDYKVTVYDPLALAAATAVLGNKATPAQSAEACIQASDLVVIATPWAQFRSIAADAYARHGGRLIVIDCWRVLPRAELESVIDIVYLGYGDHQATAPALEAKTQSR